MLQRIGVLLTALIFTGCASSVSKSPSGTGALSDGCSTPLGFIAEGRSATGYLHSTEPRGQSCQQGTLECHDGTWTGPYIYPSCVPTY